MQTKPILIMTGSAMAISACLMAWQSWSSHRLQVDLQHQLASLQQHVEQLQQSTITNPANPGAGPGNINPLALPNSASPLLPGAGSPVLPPAAGQPPVPASPQSPFDHFFNHQDPFADFAQIQQEMFNQLEEALGNGPVPGRAGNLFDNFFGSGGAGSTGNPGSNALGFGANDPADIKLQEQADAYVVTITLPEGSNIELSTAVENGQLNIQGKLTTEQKSQNQGSQFSSVQTRQFARSLPLPGNVDALGMTNETRANQVIITLPKTG